MGQRSYAAEYRINEVELAKEIGVAAAAKQLKIPSDTLYTWMSRVKNGDLPMAQIPPDPKKSLNLAKRIKELEKENKMLRSENAQIKREHEILEEQTQWKLIIEW